MASSSTRADIFDVNNIVILSINYIEKIKHLSYKGFVNDYYVYENTYTHAIEKYKKYIKILGDYQNSIIYVY
ncbi:hypothetical protein [Ectropis obliqua nucleopolyhedrovirus]|uniref:Uncharacterized protein n=1 Tax=Ectropis obliqua nucleopolyhedrovirus TaxID=59376 RepID=A0EYU0_9ABAC|nr:hypothetical protein EONV_gp037 [Ectropis obliqua nucleopolyhedrovirus]ABI35721.1 hypothetical protein [Ectropis obliqua nucleopolyhedrovirus]QWV59694.1 hypothetical protein EONV_gp037 [Ectropis obliqua nucleopolyhedrovirus]UYO72835.1 hypothetical protein EONV-gp037 [Ectropis obliqua nucleopolyhedrovirus]